MILRDLRESGWVVASNEDPGITVIAHRDLDGTSRALTQLGVDDNSASVNSSVGSFLYFGETDRRAAEIRFAFSGRSTSDLTPGILRLLFGETEMLVELPPSVTPTECATLLATRMNDEGISVTRHEDEVVFDWTAELVDSQLEIQFGIEGGAAGPTTHVHLPVRIGCESRFFVGFSRELLRGVDAFDGILGGDLGGEGCSAMAELKLPSHEVTLFANIVSNLDSGDAGVSDWTIAVDDGDVIDATFEGTVSASVTDDPPGRRDGGFNFVGLLDPEENRGVAGIASTTVLSFVQPTRLPSIGTESVLAFTVAPREETGIVLVRGFSGIRGRASISGRFRNVVTYGGVLTGYVSSNGVVLDFGEREFVRGNVNADGRVDISDGIDLLGFLFLGSAAPACPSAADVDDGGSLSLTDAISLFSFLFLGASSPSAPGVCGVDPTSDVLTCERYEFCG